MPIINETQLSGFRDLGNGSQQRVSLGRLEGQAYYYKQPPDAISKPFARLLRIINEGVCGKAVEMLKKALDNKFSTPEVQFVSARGQGLVGILTSAISYESFADRGTTKADLKRALQSLGFAQLNIIRFVLQDLDGYNNIGPGPSSIDYGLAQFPDLLKQEALTEGEQEHLPSSGDRDLFELSPKAIFAIVLEPIDDVEFLAQHVFPSFHEDILEFAISDKQLVHNYFAEVYKTFNVIAQVLTGQDFLKELKAALAFEALSAREQQIFTTCSASLVTRAQDLKATLSHMARFSTAQFGLMTAKIDKGLASLMLGAFPLYERVQSINTVKNLLIEQAEKERQESLRKGPISPANGGGTGSYGCYQGVLHPQARSHRSFSMWYEPAKTEEVKESKEIELKARIGQ